VLESDLRSMSLGVLRSTYLPMSCNSNVVMTLHSKKMNWNSTNIHFLRHHQNTTD